MLVLLLPAVAVEQDMAVLLPTLWLAEMEAVFPAMMASVRLLDALVMAHLLPLVVLAVSTVVMLQVSLEHLALELQVM